jgi:hypothetical protein
MPVLVIEQHAMPKRAARLDRRVLIGRRPGNGIVIDDVRVSRLHAWIDIRDGKAGITDAHSRTGTSVNGERSAGRRVLRNGDRIKIGPVVLTYLAGDTLPEDAEPVELRSDLAMVSETTAGLVFDCVCGAPLWAPWARAGGLGKCSYCHRRVILPAKPGLLAREAPVATPGSPEIAALGTMQDICSICQTSMEATEERTACPSCGLTFHADCWVENRGCSAYGCPEVNALDREADAQVKQIDPEELEFEPEPAGRIEIILLPVSLLAGAVGLVSFGAPAVAALIASILCWNKARNRAWLWASMAIALAGTVAGVAASKAIWLS